MASLRVMIIIIVFLIIEVGWDVDDSLAPQAEDETAAHNQNHNPLFIEDGINPSTIIIIINNLHPESHIQHNLSVELRSCK